MNLVKILVMLCCLNNDACAEQDSSNIFHLGGNSIIKCNIAEGFNGHASLWPVIAKNLQRPGNVISYVVLVHVINMPEVQMASTKADYGGIASINFNSSGQDGKDIGILLEMDISNAAEEQTSLYVNEIVSNDHIGAQHGLRLFAVAIQKGIPEDNTK
ncbi:hypothetical protein NEAUS04_0085 [Nematocida ausubeli]|uniref:Uncharacterized protein n=1 Tax=Nematocida ausubeli (strain ATCC PRA-371 / ERTm2) TaxID=1913371 RepID=A0A086J077_NEMA1|nr:uncharacterized protein NESG_02324 [Nematocida ausubeli]KAI5160688.1 hypothetical protein NEAUS04_0085 [Nematocida ausubeli]KFG25545.1 hypothetical protein NESG_02324 [Nematocida ausubeli]